MHNCTLGSVLYVQSCLVKHYGIISGINEFGELLVISNSKIKGCVAEELLTDFSMGKQTVVAGYPGNYCSSYVIERARSQLGKKYDLFSDNCEHFVRWVHHLRHESPQLQLVSILAGVLVISYLVARA